VQTDISGYVQDKSAWLNEPAPEAAFQPEGSGNQAAPGS